MELPAKEVTFDLWTYAEKTSSCGWSNEFTTQPNVQGKGDIKAPYRSYLYKLKHYWMYSVSLSAQEIHT